MSRKLFVGGLSWGTDDAALRAAFESYGELEEAVVITDRETGQSRGFGFVTYTTAEASQAAQRALDGQEVDGRRVRIDFAREGERGGGGGGSRGGGGGGGRGGGYSGGGGGGGGDRGGGGGRRPSRDPWDDEPAGGDPRQRGTKRW